MQTELQSIDKNGIITGDKLFLDDKTVTTPHRDYTPDNDGDEIAYFTVRWKTRATFVYRTKNMR